MLETIIVADMPLLSSSIRIGFFEKWSIEDGIRIVDKVVIKREYIIQYFSVYRIRLDHS